MIQQRVPIQIIIVGDSVSTTFSFDLSKVFSLSLGNTTVGFQQNAILVNPGALPDAVTLDGTPSFTPTVSVSRHVITLTFGTAPYGSPFALDLSLWFNG